MFSLRRRHTLMRLCAGGLGVSTVRAQSPSRVQVAVAANFAGPMQLIARAFEQATAHQALLSVGSTGKFYAQITQGAPFDVLLSADEATPERLVREGHALVPTRFTYAIGRLALFSALPGLVDAEGRVLRQGSFKRLSIANPKIAPYGHAARECLSALGLLPRIEPRIVQADSVAQVKQQVLSRNAELGFVAWSQLKGSTAPQGGSQWLVPANLHTALKQNAVLLRRGQGNVAALALLEFLKQPPARAIMQAHGYSHEP